MYGKVVSGQDGDIERQARQRQARERSNDLAKVESTGRDCRDFEKAFEISVLLWVAIVSLAGIGLLAKLALGA